jgi:hypothetical protein
MWRRHSAHANYKTGIVLMEPKQNSVAPGIGGWAVLADFSGLFLKAAVAGLVASIIAGGMVLLVAG